MKNTLTQSDFVNGIMELRPNNFSRAGLESLFDYLDSLDSDCGTDTEFDPIAICCEFTEYENLKEFQDNYGKDDYPDIESIEQATSVIDVDGTSFIIVDF